MKQLLSFRFVLRAIFLVLSCAGLIADSGCLKAQVQASAYVDSKGTLRWTSNNREVNEFGINYTLPFSYAYSALKQLNISHKNAIDEDIYHMARMGLTAYRVHVWDSEISDTLGNLLDNDHLRLFDYTIKAMKDRGFKFILTPIAFWPGVPEKNQELPGFSYKYGKENSFSNEGAIKAAEKYLYQFMNHVNYYTKTAYKDDPDIIAYEISNEPTHPKENAEETIIYINRLVRAIRSSGCQKPLFYCVSIATRLADAFLDADIQGGSTQWYSFALGRSHTAKGNFLTNIDSWPKPELTRKVRQKNKAFISYEFDATDNNLTFAYPVMAREFRKEGVQFAAHFTYDPLPIAYANTEYTTHYMNLAYTPQKALSLKIAGEVFRKLPVGKDFGSFPADTIFGACRVSYSENLAEFRTDEKFMYANTTKSAPISIKSLKEIAGYGSSPVVNYNGRGVYFLDRLDQGVWRLEVMPDATWVSDPFSRTSLDKEVSAIVWKTWPMSINLPDLGTDFIISGINSGNTVKTIAQNGTVSISPGTYLLTRKGVRSKWKGEDNWKNIKLNEFVAPPSTTNSYLIHQPLEEISTGSPLSISADIVSSEEPDSVRLFIVDPQASRQRVLKFQQITPYTFSIDVPNDILQNVGYLKYRIAVYYKGKSKIYFTRYGRTASMEFYPENGNIEPNDIFSTRVVSRSQPVYLFDAETDKVQSIGLPAYRHRTIFTPSSLPGKSGMVMSANNMWYLSLFFADKIAGRRSDVYGREKLVIRGHAMTDIPVNLWVSLQLKDGSEWGDSVLLTSDLNVRTIYLTNLHRISVDGPGEYGTVIIHTSPQSGNWNPKFDITEAETLKLTLIPNQGADKSPKAVIEYVSLE